MKLEEILEQLDELNDSYEDLYNREIHDFRSSRVPIASRRLHGFRRPAGPAPATITS